MMHRLSSLLILLGISVSWAQAPGLDLSPFSKEKTIEQKIRKFISRNYSEGTRPHESISILKVPRGRSLQKSNASIASPRYLSRSQFDEYSPASYMGYVHKTDGLEVIQWDNEEKFYRFFVVTQPSSLSPKIHEPPRETCTVCHQHGGPIFSRGPWREPAEGEGLDLDSKNFFSSESADFDGEVRDSARGMQKAEICKSFCMDPNDVGCERTLLLAQLLGLRNAGSTTLVAYDGATGNPIYGVAERHRPGGRFVASLTGFSDFYQKAKSQWPAQGYSYPSSAILDRDPRTGKVEVSQFPEGSLNPEKNFLPDSFFSIQQGESQASAEERLNQRTIAKVRTVEGLLFDEELARGRPESLEVPSILSADPKWLAKADPKTPRPKVYPLTIADGWELLTSNVMPSACGPDSKRIRELLAQVKDEATLKAWTDSGKLDALLRRRGQSQEDIWYSSLKQIQEGKDIPCESVSHAKAKGAENLLDQIQNLQDQVQEIADKILDQPLNAEEKSRALSGFKSCTQCHSQEGGFELGINFSDPLSISRYRDGLARKKLESHQMPPEFADHQLGDEERIIMIRLLFESESKR